MSDQQWYPAGDSDLGAGGWTKSLDGSPVTPYGSPTAVWWKRLVAIMIDNGLLYLVTMLVSLQASSSSTVNNLRLVSELILSFCYFGYLNGVMGQTVGKRVMGIRCVDAGTGDAIGFRRGLARHGVVALLSLAFFVPAFIDGLWPLWDLKRQSWHDKAVRSVVINAR